MMTFREGDEGMGEGRFTWQMALVDALPVLFFGLAAVILGFKLGSPVFFVGAIMCFLAGAGKVAWKFLIALAEKDVKLLGAQLRYLMPAGFLLMVIGAVLADGAARSVLLDSAIRLPSVAFFAAAVVGVCAMVMCARKFDRYDVRGNWIEQGINAVAQGCLLLGVLFL